MIPATKNSRRRNGIFSRNDASSKISSNNRNGNSRSKNNAIKKSSNNSRKK